MFNNLIRNLFFLHEMIYNQSQDGEPDQCQNHIFEEIAVLQNRFFQLAFRNKRIKPPAERGKNAIPQPRSQGGIQEKFSEMHLRQAGRNGNQVTNAWNQTAGKGCRNTMVIKVPFAFFHLLLVQQAHFPPTAVGELVYQRTT